jgi:polysaccharide export outer membrane protein
VYVVGEVGSPGVLPLNVFPLRDVDAISRAGGLTPMAYKGGIIIARNGLCSEVDR